MEDREDKNIRDVAAQVMTKLDQEGLILRNVVNRDDTGTRKIIFALLRVSARQGASAAQAP
jgi:hypothetical protein